MLSDHFRTRWSFLVSAISLVWIIAILLWQFTSGQQALGQQVFPLQSAAIQHEEGCAYVIQAGHKHFAWPVIQYESDTLDTATASLLVLLEDGKPVGQPHTPHVNIRNQGQGNYSHWADKLYFSASDCSDPRSNGRNYVVSMSGELSSWARYLWLIAVCVLCVQLRMSSVKINAHPASEDPVINPASWLLAFLISGVILTARGAADFGQYEVWAKYFATFDLAVFSGYFRSVTGVPLSQWSYGAGLLAAIPAVLLRYPDAMPVSFVAVFLGVANLGLLIYIAFSITRSFSKAVLCLAAVILFTPAGFYLNKFSAEGWTIFLVLAGLALMEWDKKHTGRLESNITLYLGMVFYFLLLVKIQNIVLCAGLWLIFVATNLTAPLRSRANLDFVLNKTLILFLVSGVGLIFLLSYNHIVSDNFLKSPYAVGDDEFSMFSIHNLKIFEVLLSLWHGLLVYHPVTVLCVYYLLRGFGSSRVPVPGVTLIISASLIALVLQVIIQGSWYIWWMGTGTYGARGFVGTSLLLAYALLKAAIPEKRPLSNLTFISIMIVGGYSAFMLSMEETNIVTYMSFSQLIKHDVWYIVVAVFLCMYLTRQFIKPERTQYLTYLLPALAMVPGIYISIKTSTGHLQIMAIVLIVIGLCIFFDRQYKALQSSRYPVHRVFAGIIIFFFTASILLQARMLGDFYVESIQSGQAGYGLDCREFVDSLKEYHLISGYEREKNALYEFLIRQKCI